MIRRPPRSTPLSLHDALPISPVRALLEDQVQVAWACLAAREATGEARYLEIAEDLVRLLERDFADTGSAGDRKSTRLNSSHGYISYAVFCLKKKKKTRT